MHGRQHVRCEGGLDELTSLAADPERGAQQGLAAVAPRHTITVGRMSAISASTQGRQAVISARLGFS
jgi:hypothetical protein